jgi:hypothetical protein
MTDTHIADAQWDHNGSWRVTVVGPWPRTEQSERRARAVARRVDTMRLVQWTRLDGVSLTEDIRVTYRFTVSRLSRDYYSRPSR